MTRSLVSLGLALAVAFTAGAASAQGRGGGGFMRGGGGGGAMMLITAEPVQKELGLSAEAIEKLAKLTDSFREEMQAKMSGLAPAGGLQDLNDEQRREIMTKMQDAMRKLQEDFQPKLKAELSADQYKRLQQIGWQSAGSSALVDADVAKSLKVTEDQQKKVRALLDDYQTKQRTMMQEAFANGAGQEAFAKIQELTKERDAKALEILTKDQQAQFAELKGKPFDMSQLQGFGRGGPGGGRGRRGAPQ